MKTNQNTLSKTRLNRLRTQGYTIQTDQELSDMAFGIRFLYRLCTCMIVIAILTESSFLFAIMFVVAFWGIILPNHPFDYIYNHILSKRMNKPQLPPRAVQLKFACTIATLWLGIIITFLSVQMEAIAFSLAGFLAIIASLPSTIDYCIPSVIYHTFSQAFFAAK